MLKVIREEWLCWVAAIRGLRTNPIAGYFTRTEQRRRKRMKQPLWARILLAVILLALVSFIVWLFFQGMFGYSGWRQADLAVIFAGMAYSVLAVITLFYILNLLRRLFSTCIDAFGVLGIEVGKARPRRLVIDDMIATTTLTDHEITAGVLYILAPRLWMLSLIGGVIAWLGLVTITLTQGYQTGYDTAVQVILTGPLTVGGITACGVLASIVMLTWLIVLGNSVSNRLYASAAAVMIILGQLALIPTSIALTFYRWEMCRFGTYEIGEYIQAFLGIALLVTLAHYGLLSVAVRMPGRMAFFGWLVPMLLPLGVLAVSTGFTYSLYSSGYGMYELAGLAYTHAWAALQVCNLSAVPSGLCLPLGNYYIQSSGLILESGFLVQLFQLTLMVFIGLNAARLAVHTRRQNLA